MLFQLPTLLTVTDVLTAVYTDSRQPAPHMMLESPAHGMVHSGLMAMAPNLLPQ
jgi:hypothetical protein